MIEKVNPSHPDKIADRIAGAIVDIAYTKNDNPKIAVEVLIGHRRCFVIIETSEDMYYEEVNKIVKRIGGNVELDLTVVKQDEHLANNQNEKIRCGDNGIFKGAPVTQEQMILGCIARYIYASYPYDGKYVLDGDKLIICQSNAKNKDLKKVFPNAIINPLGEWTGGTNVDTGATNRKLGSDMADSITGGGLCLSGDTEYLGEDLKWHRIENYKGGKIAQWNNGLLEFVDPIAYIQNVNDELILFKNNSKLSMCLTPNHDILIETSKRNLVKRKASLIAEKINNEVGNSGSIIHNFLYRNKEGETSKYKCIEEMFLQVAFCADGTLLKDNKSWSGRIRVKKQYKKDRLRRLLKNRNYKETNDKEYSIFWINPPVKSKSLYECFKDEAFHLIKDELYKWDGDEKIKVFRTTKKEDADFAQLIIASTGKVATITKSDRIGEKHANPKYTHKCILYVVHELSSTKTHLRKSKQSTIKIEYLKEKQNSYCFNVPSHNLIVRHDRKIFITGNCGKDLSKADISINIYAFLKAQLLGKTVQLSCAIGDEIVDGKPYEEIVEAAREYIKAIGGFEKLAEWGLF